MDEFAVLESRNAREYWEHEEYDFTPWLASEIENEEASDFENALGLDLEVIEREKSVGKYSVDIYARVVDDGRTVIIENQLNDSDHDHLGKSIAYAAGVDADIIVWVAPRFNDEHLDAIQWLNAKSREDVDLFAIRLEVWTIQDSPPAVRLNPVEKPSEWKEKAQRTTGELNERDKRREQFWTAFRDRIVESETPLRPRKPQPRHYYSNPIGVGGFHLSYYIDEKENELGLELIIEDSEKTYRALREHADEIEEKLRTADTTVYWGELRETSGKNMRSEVGVKRDIDVEDTESWDAYFDWMFRQGELFHEIFPERLHRIDNN
jgi:hypothetical protein